MLRAYLPYSCRGGPSFSVRPQLTVISIAKKFSIRSEASPGTPERQKTLPAGLVTRRPCRVTSGLARTGLIPAIIVLAVGLKPGSQDSGLHRYYIVIRGVFQISNRLKNSAGSKNVKA